MAVAIEQQQNKIHPKRFALWLGIAAIVMLFASLTSAYIVRQGAGDWKSFKIPTIFWVNTIVILASSGTIQWAVNAHKKYNDSAYKLAITLTTLLGAAFLVGQYIGWIDLMKNGNFIDGNPAESFFYVIPGIHAVHILGGLIVLVVMTIRAFVKPFNPNKLLGVELIATYWHFVDFLWIYLFIFLQIKFS
jgi:cytochrome c oxidase subunit 3